MGGTAGHMCHPFEAVESGKDLINFYKDTLPKYIFKQMYQTNHDEKEISLKLDGLNCSFRFVKEINDEFKVLIDRGAIFHDVIGVGKEKDISGKTGKFHFKNVHSIEERFPKNFIMQNVYKRLFGILKEALKDKNFQAILSDENLDILNYGFVHNVFDEEKNIFVTHEYDSTHEKIQPEISETITKLSKTAPERNHVIFNIEAIHPDPDFQNIVKYKKENIKAVLNNIFQNLESPILTKYGETVYDGLSENDGDEIKKVLDNNSGQPFMFFVINGIIHKEYKKTLSKNKIFDTRTNFLSLKELERNTNFKHLIKILNKFALKHRAAFVTRLKISTKKKISLTNDDERNNKIKEDYVKNFSEHINSILEKVAVICNDDTKTLGTILDNIKSFDELRNYKITLHNINDENAEPKTVDCLNRETLYCLIENEHKGHINIENYLTIKDIDGKPIKAVQDISNPDVLKNKEKIIQGVATWISTIKIGEFILKQLVADHFGSILAEKKEDEVHEEHEGIVLDNPLGNNIPIKITGNFINRMCTESPFNKK